MSFHELLVTATVTSIVLGGVYHLFDQGLRAYAVGTARVEATQAARAAIVRMSAEIRNAGRGAVWDGAAIVVAEPSRIVIASDLDADGNTSDRGEQITWQLVGSVLRRNAGAGAQPVANGISALELRYYDAAGQATSVPADVRIVDVALAAESTLGGGNLARGVATRIETRVRLRNR